MFEIHFQACRRRFWEFGAISRTYQNPPCWKPWAIAQAFCSKTANIRPSRIHPKSTQTVAQGVRNPFRWVKELFQRVWSDFKDLPKSAMFETMGYSPGFLLKKRPISNPCEFTRNRHKHSLEELEINLEGSSRLFREFGAISWTYQNPPCSKPWAIAQAFCSKTANSRPSRIHPKSTQTVAQGVRNPFRLV